MQWSLLILSLPTENASARMRAWRGLKSLGAASLRDGVYLMPDGESAQVALDGIAKDVNGAGGQAWVLQAEAGDEPFATLFDRSEDYRRLAVDIDAVAVELGSSAPGDLARLARKLRKNFDALAGIDFFPGEARRQVAARLEQLEQAIRTRESPDEPHAAARPLERRDPAAYRGRLWATRARPWVDRLASAWLIHRFIDREARFLWLTAPADCPAEALGFDFDGAAFTHVGDFVSFETLMHSFALESDPALARFARLVHFLDVGGLPVPEAAGLEALLAGMRNSISDDDALLASAAQSFDFIYAQFQHAA